jgi:hypothetical protein
MGQKAYVPEHVSWYRTTRQWQRVNEPLRIQLCKERREHWSMRLLRYLKRREVRFAYFVIGLLIGGVLM